jgi:hypothetical protein
MGKITGFLARSAAGQRSTCLLVAIFIAARLKGRAD